MVGTYRRSPFRLDDMLRGVRWALSAGPAARPAPASAGVRDADAEPIRFGPAAASRLRIRFRIDGRGFLEDVEPDPFDDGP